MAIVGGRIVSGAADVGTTEAIHGGTGRGDHGTVGAGAERPVVGSSVGHHVLPVAGGTVPAAGTDVAPSIDATGLLVAPGLVDLQCNGAGGIDLSAEPERLWEVAALPPRWDVTAWLPTIVTGPPEIRVRALAALRVGPPASVDPGRCATPLGLHLQGPFLSGERRGAHRAEFLAAPAPAVVEAECWSAEAGVALTDARVRVGLIADGVHLHPTTVALAPMLGPRLSLVTDAIAALGGPGDVGGGTGVRLADGTLAGSTLSLDRAVRNLDTWAGLSLPAALAAASATAADVLGLADRGWVAPGAVGDVLLDRSGEVMVTVIGGRVAFDRRTLRPHPRYS